MGDPDKEHAVDIKQLDQLGEVGKRPRQTVYLVDDDDVDLAGADIVQQPLQVRPVLPERKLPERGAGQPLHRSELAPRRRRLGRFSTLGLRSENSRSWRGSDCSR